MDFQTILDYAKKCVMEKYADFSGRARRAEYADRARIADLEKPRELEVPLQAFRERRVSLYVDRHGYLLRAFLDDFHVYDCGRRCGREKCEYCEGCVFRHCGCLMFLFCV